MANCGGFPTSPSARHQLWPLEENPVTKEPFLRLPAPHQNIILTPFRQSDAVALVPILNDTRVVLMLLGPPYPYTLTDGEFWVNAMQERWNAVMAKFDAAEKANGLGEDGARLEYVDACPVGVIREQHEDGTEELLGNCSFMRNLFTEVRDQRERDALITVNEAREVGDPTISWQVGYYLASSHHGRGIMSTVMKTLLHKWAIPRMNMRHLRANPFLENIGSKRVLEKAGFAHLKTLEEVHTMPESKGGGKKGAYILEWRYQISGDES